VRTYVRRPDWRDGLWFLTFEVASAVMLAARYGVGAPYRIGDLASASTAARWGTGVHDVARSRRTTWSFALANGSNAPTGMSGSPLDGAPTPAASEFSSRPRIAPVQRGHRAVLRTLLRSAGLPAPDGEPVVHFFRRSPGRSRGRLTPPSRIACRRLCGRGPLDGHGRCRHVKRRRRWWVFKNTSKKASAPAMATEMLRPAPRRSCTRSCRGSGCGRGGRC
jgi:hypothetical protein